jgi:uncharacterized membrane protein YraQ (UPF0718 family)
VSADLDPEGGDRVRQDAPATPSLRDAPHRLRPSALLLLNVGLLAFLVGQRWLIDWADQPALSAFTTIFLSIVLQATPFLVLGVLLSAAIGAFVSPSLVRRALPRNPALAVPVAGSAGLVLPGCECASVPIAGGLMARGVAPAAALTFLLAAPAINPIVLAATWVAFPNDPSMVWARLVASLLAAVAMGWLWLAMGRQEWIRMPSRAHLANPNPWVTFHRSATHDFLHAGGFLVVGGLTAAAINVLVPAQWLDSLAGQVALSVLALALLAVVMCICSEADAFVAASMSQFSPVAQLAFMVVGPMVDLKLVAMQAGAFGRSFAQRFAPATFVVAVTSASLVGGALL